MIIDLPTAEELIERADALLHLACSVAMKLHHDQNEDWAEGIEDEAREEYWIKCRPALANALALVQQSHELYLKGRIVAVSPFLIIARDPQHWPKDGATRDISFTEFLTLGAAELPRVHDLVCSTRLDEATRKFLQDVRELRNAFVHQGAASASRAGEVIDLVLRTHQWIYPTTPWFQARGDYLANDHMSALYSSDHVTAELHYEFATLMETVTPANFKLWFGASKKTLWFRCLHCVRNTSDYGDPSHTAQLRPNTRTAGRVVCLVCGEETAVERRRCGDPDCGCTVHSHPDEQFEEVCLLCGAGRDFLEDKLARERTVRDRGVKTLWDLVPDLKPDKPE